MNARWYHVSAVALLAFLLVPSEDLAAAAPRWEWVRHFGGSNVENVGGIALDPDGNAYVAGMFWSQSMSLGGVTFTNNGNLSGYVCKVSSRGDLIWAVPILSQGALCFASDVALGPNGEVMVGLWFDGTLTMGETNFTSQGSTDILLAQFDREGQYVQGFHFGGLATSSLAVLRPIPLEVGRSRATLAHLPSNSAPSP